MSAYASVHQSIGPGWLTEDFQVTISGCMPAATACRTIAWPLHLLQLLPSFIATCAVLLMDSDQTAHLEGLFGHVQVTAQPPTMHLNHPL